MFFIMAVIMAVCEKKEKKRNEFFSFSSKSSGDGETKRSHGSPAASNEESDYD